MFSIICAIGKNNEIGYKNKLLWNLPGDMKFFQKKTLHHTVVMGKKTFLSIGKALKNRKNIVIAQELDFKLDDCDVYYNLDEVIKKYKNTNEEIFIIGGASIYKQFIEHSQKLYLTLVDDSPLADTYFPDYKNFKIIKTSDTQENNSIKYKFVEFEKI